MALLLTVALSTFITRAAISISTSTSYTQNFDAIGTSATATLPADFKVDKQSSVRAVGSYSAAGSATERVGGANLSTSAANGIYNFGSGTTTTGSDRAIGFLSSSGGTTSGNLYAQLVNNTGGNLSGLQISYDVEKYRNGSNAAGFRFQLFYSTDGTSWTNAGADFFTSFSADANNNGFATAPGATVSVSNKTLNVTIANGSNFYLAWNYSVTSGTTVTNSQALAIDNISILGIGVSLSTNPSGIGAANPNSLLAGDSTLLAVAVTPGTNPTSTGLAVTGNLSTIGGSATQSFFDDGTNGDVTAGDNIFSYQTMVGVLTPAGTKTLPVTIVDAQSRTGSTSISLTVEPPLVPIHTIQGSGNTSPYANTLVRTTGIVTGLKSNGFFVQDPNPDADPLTSEGIFVFTGSPRPASPVIGDAVQVRGTVAEFISSADPFSQSITELSNFPTITVQSSNNPLPAPVPITAADTTVNNLNNLERFEFMRVSVASLTVVAPTDGFKDEANATSASDGVFYGVITGVARPFREPGIQIPDPVPAPNPVNVPRFDANPERIRVDSDAQPFAAAIDVTTGATVSNLVGPLDYGARTYTILPDAATPPTVTGNVSATPVGAANADEFTVASLNMERFYNDVNDPGGDAVLTTTAFNNRLNKASLLIRNVMRSPDIIGVVEMENLATLQAVANKINTDAVAAGDPDPNYQAYLEEGNDVGLIDVGFLVKASRVNAIDVTQEGKTTTYINPNNGQPELLNDRPPLILRATIQPANGAPYPVTVIVNHLRSLNGVDDPADGNRIRTKRRAQAEFLANLIQTRQTANPNERIISVGDYNAFQFNDGYVDSIGTIKGTPAAADQVVLPSSDLVNPDLVDLGDFAAGNQQYSFIFDGNAQELDHVLITQNLLDRFTRLQYARVNADFPEVYRSDANRPERLSDHDGLVAYFSFPKADLAITKSASPTTPLTGSNITYTLTVTNSMDDPAADVVVADQVPANTTFQSITAPAGWTCTTPNVGDTGAISCTTSTLAPGTSAVITLVVNVDCATANGTTVSNTATVSSSTLDLDTSNNTRTATTMVSNPPPVISNVSVDKPAVWPPNHKLVDVTVNYTVTDNCGAVTSSLSVSSNEPENGTGDGDTSPDWIVVDAHHLWLRAERAGTGEGRIYTITITSTDSAGNSSSQTTQVVVPKNQK